MEKRQKIDDVMNKDILPLQNRLGKQVAMSSVCFTNEGKIMLKRPKKEVVKRTLVRAASESTLQIQYHYATEAKSDHFNRKQKH